MKTWQERMTQEELKFELECRLIEIKEFLSSDSSDENKLNLLLTDLNDTIKMCKRIGVKYNVEEL